MDTYSSRVIAPKAPFDSEAAAKDEAISSRARISVEGYEFNKDTENEIRIQLVNHFKSCGYVSRVDFPPEPLLDSRAFVTIFGDGAKEKALQLNGSDMGGWNALEPFDSEPAAKEKFNYISSRVRISVEGFSHGRLTDEIKSELINHFKSCGDLISVEALVKFAPREEDLDYQVSLRYHRSLYSDLANDERFWYGIAVLGYDTSLPEDQVKSILTEHFSSCGVITHVFVCTPDECTNIYFSKKEDEASAMDLNGSKVGGFKITTMLLATAISNPRLAPGDEPTVGYSIPAPFLEFAREINKKRDDYMTEWRVKARRERVIKARREQAFKAS
ncbi:hypothetical protein F2Q68_00027714 [Brassica cretica]|uniref:RRM domain-containing protein n=1 Tax=Brassica cretica TaxID=69181 RepID=A0A8S9IK07_BRACR|nr:hypothetical protein F2Q68_00027714 [Brassica cretica]